MSNATTADTTEVFYIAGQGNGGTCEVYHTDRDCPMLQRAETVHEWTIVTIRENRDKCQFCDGDIDQGEQDRGHIRALKAAGADDE